MKIMVVGGGGREHAIIKKIKVTLADHAGAVLLSMPKMIKVKIGTL